MADGDNLTIGSSSSPDSIGRNMASLMVVSVCGYLNLSAYPFSVFLCFLGLD